MKNTLIFILIIFAIKLNAQGIIGTPNSLILVYNYPDNHFYIEIEGKDKRKTEQENAFIIDNKVVLINVINIKKFYNGKSKKSSNDIIQKYIDWESDYLKESFGFEVNGNIDFLKSEKGKEIAYWTYDMETKEPEKNSDSTITTSVSKQMFVITRSKDYVIGIYTPFLEDQVYNEIKEYLIKNIDGLVESDKEIDIEDLNKRVNNL